MNIILSVVQEASIDLLKKSVMKSELLVDLEASSISEGYKQINARWIYWRFISVNHGYIFIIFLESLRALGIDIEYQQEGYLEKVSHNYLWSLILN